MSVIYTILIIIAALIIAPFAFIGLMYAAFAALLAFIFLIIVSLVGIEPSSGVFITCFVMGGVVILLYYMGKKIENQAK